MVKGLHLPPRHRKEIVALLHKHLPGVEVWAYGSRVNGQSHEGSDLDLALRGPRLAEIDTSRLADFIEALQDSTIPFLVEVRDWARLPTRFHHEIERAHVVLAEREERTAGSGWREFEFASLCDITRGASPRPIHEWTSERGIPWVKISDASNSSSRFIERTRERIRSEGRTKSVSVVPGDLILSNSATPGIPMLISIEACIHDGWLLLRNFRDLDKLFCYYLLLYEKPRIVRQGTGTVFNNLKTEILKRHRVKVPPLHEQRAIAHILGTLDDKIELNRRMNETLESMARALFKSWFVDFEPVRAKMAGRDTGLPQDLADLFPDRLVDSELGEIPEGWEATTLGEHVANFDSKRIPVSRAERAKRQGPFPYHGAASVMDHVNNYLFDGIYLLIGEDGSVIRESGVAVTQYVWGKFWVNNHAHVLQGRGPVSTEQVYLYFCFEPIAPYVTGAVQPKLSQGRMNDMPFLFPGAAICKGFARAISPWFAMRRACSLESKTLTALRDTLLPRLISGEQQAKNVEQLIGEARP